jgi:dipeptidyl aminopeptidase/acylaminoacyl peptidase
MGIHFSGDRRQTYWLDAALQRIQRGVDAALPAGRTNRLYCGRCESTRFIVVRSSSDRQPGEYLLFDRSNSQLQSIGFARPWIDESLQGRRSFHRIAASDGLQIPVYVTHPAGAKPDQWLPSVLLVHGGPWVRGADLGWEAEAQFLASRGYRVLEPEFRGSEGYGWRHFRAGWKQWGSAMQDDLADTVRWAVKQGLTDPTKVCIVGASYGGYAALMGPISHPGTYRCAASFAGVTDLNLMYSINWSDFSEDYKRYGMPLLVGDQVKDAVALERASPLKRAAEIKVPVLVAHGGEDRRVPIEHERKFVAAARDAGVDIEVHLYPNEGHGFFEPVNHTDYYGHLERFLAKALKPTGE